MQEEEPQDALQPGLEEESKLVLTSIASSFFRLGLVAFGGPAAHISMMETEFVERRKLLRREDYLDMVGAANLIPGPNSTETVMHVGYRLGGWTGLLVAGASFILPAAVLTALVAIAYVAGRDLNFMLPVLSGIQAAIIALIGFAVWKLGKKAAKSNVLTALAVLAGVFTALGIPEVLVILGAGALILIWSLARQSAAMATPVMLWQAASLITPEISASGVWREGVTAGSLFLTFLKTGAVLFGSGYVLVAYLEADLVDRLNWLTSEELLDAIAMGQFTPGPVLTTATFVGQLLGGFPGAVLATLGIFLPSFVFVALTAPIIPKLRKSNIAAPFLDGANAGAVGVMASVLISLSMENLTDPFRIALAIAAAILLGRMPKLSPILLVVGAGMLGAVYGMF